MFDTTLHMLAGESPALPPGVLFEEQGIRILSPARGSRYSREEWETMVATQVYRSTSCEGLIALTRDFVRELRVSLSVEEFAKVEMAWRRGVIRNPDGMVAALLGNLQSQLSSVAMRDRTPECLLEKIQCFWIPQVVACKDWLVLMRDVRLYRAATPAQEVVTHLRGTHAWKECEQLTSLFQGIRYGEAPGSLIPTWSAVAQGNASINQVLAGMKIAAERERATAVAEAADRAHDLRRVVAILAAHFAAGGSSHQTTLTRILLERSRGRYDLGRQCREGGCAGTLRIGRVRILGPVLPRDLTCAGMLHFLPLIAAAAAADPSPEALHHEAALRHQAKARLEAGDDPKAPYRSISGAAPFAD